MLRRLLNEDIELTVVLEPELGHAQVDAGQIEQVVMNLAVNARDAMPMGGRLTIETRNVELDGADGAPRRYIVIAVTDTGCGMSADTQRRMFEPFFTTKELGTGTGLGLAICHGIVSQSGGYLEVTSELGRGSVFKVFLPRCDVDIEKRTERAPGLAAGGHETVLLVEDNAPLRNAVRRMLEGGGYQVLEAQNADDAADLAQRHASALALLLTDVVMPQASGPEVARAVQRFVPEIKLLFMSGHTDHAALSNSVLEGSANFIQKPFSQQMLGKRVREAIDS
jgi:CheY-like chemotaxis protein